MEQVMADDKSTADLDTFLDFLYGGLTGYVYLAAKTPGNDKDWKQEFFKYPEDRTKLKTAILNASPTHEIYIAPALYAPSAVSAGSAEKEHIAMSQVAWADFDDNAPEFEGDIIPSLIIQSSTETRQHVYWKLTEPITDIDTLEKINRDIAYNFSADGSGWDATQVLRPPCTFNHKRQEPVRTIHHLDKSFSPDYFNVLTPTPEAPKSSWELGTLPSPETVILKYAFSPDMAKLLQREKHEIKDRSASLMNLAYGLCQMGLTDSEVFTILLLADDRWEKFKTRKDRYKRLSHIVVVARNKYPDQTTDDEAFTMAFGFESFLNTEINIEWLIEPMLMENGSMMLVGPSGIGKTQISIQFMVHLALGKDYLHYKIKIPKKVLFLSLEMDHGSLKKFLEAVNGGLSDADRALLEQNLIIIPHGEPWPLNTANGQAQLVQWLETIEPDVLFVDSVGSAVRGNISADENVMPLLDFNDHIRKRYNLAVWYIHHMRKQIPGANHAASQDDIYGNQYLLNRSTSAYGVLRAKLGNIKVRNFKNRLAPAEQDYIIERIDNLNFKKVTEDVDHLLNEVNVKLNPEGKPDTKSGNNFDL